MSTKHGWKRYGRRKKPWAHTAWEGYYYPGPLRLDGTRMNKDDGFGSYHKGIDRWERAAKAVIRRYKAEQKAKGK